VSSSISRREFLKLGALALGGLGVRSLAPLSQPSPGFVGRVAYESVSVFDLPRLNATTLGYKFRDELLNVEYPVTPLSGPAYNPLWYRISEGFVHSGLIQPVSTQANTVLDSIPETGILFRLTMPFSRPYNYSNQNGWQPEQRFLLYYHSNHWVTDLVEGPDGNPWYQITETWEGVQYYADSTHLQLIPSSELEPISPDVPASEKRIEISLQSQLLTAFEGNSIFLRTSISSGVQNSGGAGLPTETPIGSFNIYSKQPAKYMGDNRLTDTLGDRYLPGVPWTAFFAEGGYAIHGAYWHNNFGAPMSRGCVNVRPDIAQKLYRWMTPLAGPDEMEAVGNGTRVIVS
jgi:lipoprotein-anchoring transpeptidase ErfK/SrfK